MKILGLIPARGGSKGVPGKNIKSLCGKPLLQYTWESAKESRLLAKTILSSDDKNIIEIAENFGLHSAFVRPAEFAKDTTPSIEVIKHAIQFFQEKGEIFDAVCLLQPTTPLRSHDLIDFCIEKFIEGNYDSLITVREVPEEYNPHWVFEEKQGSLKIATGENEIIPRRQELPKSYFRDGAIYLTKVDVILNQNSLFGNKIGFYNTENTRYVNIDTPEDWEKAEKIISGCAE